MSTKLLIDTLNDEEINNNHQIGDGEYIELSEEFLYDVIVNEKILKSCLSEKEIELLRPNWGDIQLKSTNILEGQDREHYLYLLEEVIKTYSTKRLNAFLNEKGITSNKLCDRAKSPHEIKKIIEKIIRKFENEFKKINKFGSEFQKLIEFLDNKIQNKEKILIEFID